MDITSRKNDKAVHLRKLGMSSSFRHEQNEFFGDGIKLFNEAVKWGVEIHDVFYCEDMPENIPTGAKVYRADRQVIEFVSPLKTPQNIIFSAKIPASSQKPTLKNAIVLENMQDPGNVGTMIRTANAFKIQNVLLVGSCADPWSSKTIRASMGAVFRENIFTLTMDQLRELKSDGTKLYGAALSDKSEDLRRCNISESAVVIGNEGNGLTDTMMELCDGDIIIPMNPACESLNAAAAATVIMWEMMRDRI
jgi:TrmH family RNA methyltransferase